MDGFVFTVRCDTVRLLQYGRETYAILFRYVCICSGNRETVNYFIVIIIYIGIWQLISINDGDELIE